MKGYNRHREKNSHTLKEGNNNMHTTHVST